MNMLPRLLVAAVAVGFVAAAGGCLVMSGKSIDESGVRVTEKTLAQIEPGVTSEAWLRATLGEPTEEACVAGRSEVRVLKYEHTICKSEGGMVLFVFAGGSEKREIHTTYFEVADGVVSRYWSEP